MFVSFSFACSMYFSSLSDGSNDLSMSIDLTRWRPDNVRTWDRTTYSQFLNIDAVGHDATIMTSFDIPCTLWPEVPSVVWLEFDSFYIGSQYLLLMCHIFWQILLLRMTQALEHWWVCFIKRTATLILILTLSLFWSHLQSYNWIK